MSADLRFRIVLFLMPLIVLLVRILGRTIRWRKRYDFESYQGKIYAVWHGHALALALFAMDRNIYALASKFRDGEIAARLLKGLGFKVVRGSTEEGKVEKGGRTGTLKLITALTKGYSVAITVDGPKGPPFRVKKGVVFLAQKTGAEIVPVVVKFKKAKELSSWDKFLIPYPFTKGLVITGEKVTVSEKDDLEQKRLELEKKLSELSSLEVSWEDI